MKKKDKKPVGKGAKNQKKEKKQKDPKEYIPQNLLTNLRPTKLITATENSARGAEDDETAQNYSPDYKPEFIPCKIAEEWTKTTEEEINNELLQYEKVHPGDIYPYRKEGLRNDHSERDFPNQRSRNDEMPRCRHNYLHGYDKIWLRHEGVEICYSLRACTDGKRRDCHLLPREHKGQRIFL